MLKKRCFFGVFEFSQKGIPKRFRFIYCLIKLYFGEDRIMPVNFSEYAMIEVNVTTSGGILPLADAKVKIVYEYVGGEYFEETKITDIDGRTGVFRFPVRRAVIGGKRVDFPRRAECNVEISADGYVPLSVKGVHLFPGVTVVGSFDVLLLKSAMQA
jgi:hypothetical protein